MNLRTGGKGKLILMAIVLIIMSVGLFAANGSLVFNSSVVEPEFPAPLDAEIQPIDTTIHRNVKKTDYPDSEHSENFSLDLKDPDNLKADTAVYDEQVGAYRVGTRLGDSFLSAPFLMSPLDYLKWNERTQMGHYFKARNDSLMVRKGKEKFDFTDMHFDLGPAEKIFGPGGVRIKINGSAELKFGYNYKYTDNPSLSERNRKQANFDFDEKINANIQASVGDKMNFNLKYNTEATFDYDAKNLKLAYEGKEDDIVKLLEGGYVSFPSNNSLVRGAQSLFGIRTDLQFGKLKLQTVLSQKKSQSKTVSSKGGAQLSTFELQAYDYDENRHFYMAHFFHDNYDQFCANLPTVTSGITINRVEIWVTNTGGATENTRNIVGFVDLAENRVVSDEKWLNGGSSNPQNSSNSLYSTLVADESIRYMDTASEPIEALGLKGGIDYEKIENARLLTSSEYTLNQHLGYISLKSTLQPNQVVAIAYEYTYGGKTYQVGEFSADIKDNDKSLYVKLLKNTTNSPEVLNWRLMMKNVYSLNAQSIQRDRFKLDIKYLCDTTGVAMTYIPEEKFKQTTLLKMMNLDRLDDNNKTNPNGKFDFLEGYTVLSQSGMIIFPVAEPFGEWLAQQLGDETLAEKYCYYELYNSTKTVAKRVAEKAKFSIEGEFKGSSGNEIYLGSTNIPQGSVIVTAGGVTLTEGSDYTVDYASGRVTIINQSIIDAGTNVSVSMESNEMNGMVRKTMLGVNWDYDYSKDLQFGGTFMRLTEKPLTTKVAMGSEPLNNTVWGLHVNWKTESQWLTDLVDKLPFIEATSPSSINFKAEFAQLIAGKPYDVQGNASYIDDFENTKNKIDIKTPNQWVLSSTPSVMPEGTLKNDLSYGYNRAKLAWYVIDPLFTRRSSSLTPSHIKSDTAQLSNHYVREVFVRELYPNKDTNQGESNTLDVLNIAYYPDERGPYNFSTEVYADANNDVRLEQPRKRWGGMMRKIDTSDFETSNIQYVEFWMLDPFIYNRNESGIGGKLVINLGDVSEDVLKDGKKSFESGIPVSNAGSVSKTAWGYVSDDKSVVYAFSTESNARDRQDVGLDGLSDDGERAFDTTMQYLSDVKSKLGNDEAYDKVHNDPAADNYSYFRGSRLDENRTSILDRYKNINSPERNSPNSTGNSFNEAYKTTPDVEDINQDYTMNEYENYYEYSMEISPQSLKVGQGYIVDARRTNVKLRNGRTEEAIWYQFRIPIESGTKIENGVSKGELDPSSMDFSSIRFMRMYLTDFEKPVVLRFGSLDLVKGEWRTYNQPLVSGNKQSNSGTIKTYAVNIEENNDKTPVNYVLPPGITREEDPSQSQLTQQNEQSLALQVENLAPGDAKAVYKNTMLDLRQYKHVQMFVHANALEGETTLTNNQMSVFVRFGSDYKSNYYEYEIPLTLTPPGRYDTFTTSGCEAVWPEQNMLDLDLEALTNVKQRRNANRVSYTTAYSEYDPDKPNNKITVVGNPSLGEVKTMMVGVRNNGRETHSVETWVDELRLQNYNNDGGWAAQGSMNVRLSDLGSVNLAGHMETAGYGGLEEGVTTRNNDNSYQWSITTNFELGKFFPDSWKMQMPIYYSYSWQKISPKYNPFDTDMLLSDALDASENPDSLSDITEKVVKSKNFSLSNWKSNWAHKTPWPIDPANFSLSYSSSKNYKRGQTTIGEKNENWKGSLQYNYSPKYKTFEPFKNLKWKSKWADIIKAQNLNWMPQRLSINMDITRSYYEFQERDVEAGTQLPVVSSSQFLWNRQMTLQWDIFKALKLNFTSNTHAEIEEPYVDNKNLYIDNYEAWKDSVTKSILHMGRPLTYNSTFSGSYTVPFNRIPIFDWISADGSYNSTYGWTRGAELANKRSLGNTAVTQRSVNINGRLNMETLYKKVKFLDEAYKRFSGKSSTTEKKSLKTQTRTRLADKDAEGKDVKKDPNSKEDADAKKTNAQSAENTKTTTERKRKAYSKEITLNDSTDTEIPHGQKSKRLIVRARTANGKSYKVKYSIESENIIHIKNRDTVTLKLSVVAKKPVNHDGPLYTAAQALARAAMMVRNVSISYRNNYSMSLPGFRTDIGDFFGQKSINGILSPGLDFAFGAIGDNYLNKAMRNGWLITGDSITTPATTTETEDAQLRVTLEPLRDVKIDLNASRTVNRSNSIQFMYDGMPRQKSGSFNMTTISIKSAFATTGDINDNYNSKPFNDFLANLPIVRERVERQYAGSVYPKGVGPAFEGKTFDPANGTVDMYSADVMIPAFMAAYCSGSPNSCSLDIFPSIFKMLPNWSLSYSGLSKLSWFSEKFKSFNINHSYKSVYSVGAYNSFTNFVGFMDDLGYVLDVTSGNPIPSSLFNISTVSISESFSPLIGVDMTFNSGLTGKMEYRKMRALNLSMTSVALTENYSNDIVVGLGYKIKDINLFGAKGIQDPSTKKKNAKKNAKSDDSRGLSQSGSSSRRNNSISHDLNIRCDFSYRMQNAINRNIMTNVSTGTNGSTAYKIAITADYQFSRMLTMSGFIDWQKNVPLVSTNSYPTTTADFGLSVKFQLTRQ
ncbi:MAG: cell surface protein SprA [Bacteroidaceae bacterium]|nr:cell surface protein SprA [Bacteroidaceae bacterium]